MEKTFKDYYQFPLYIDDVIPFKAWCGINPKHMAYDVLQWNLSPALYQELVDIINGNMPVTKSKEWSKPDKYINKVCDIYAFGSEKPIIRVRGWGTLTGAGGFHLDETTAEQIQDDFINYILERLNTR